MVSRMRNDKLILLVIGLNGATFDVIRLMIATGELPHLAALVDKGDGSQGMA